MGVKSFITLGPVANGIKLLRPQFTNVHSKLERLYLANFSQPSLKFESKAGTSPNGESAPLSGRLPALAINIRLYWKLESPWA